MLVVLAALLARHGSTALPVVKTGKAATAALFIGLPVLMFAAAVPRVGVVALPVGLAFSIVGAVLYWVAGVIYIVQTRRLIAHPPVADGTKSDTLEE